MKPVKDRIVIEYVAALIAEGLRRQRRKAKAS